MTFMITNATARFVAYSTAREVFCGKMTVHTFNSLNGQVPKNLKGKGTSSSEWLTRQLKDPYVEKAKLANYRCRSAFKLLEINEKHNILSPGFCVIDCGSAPGSWIQVAVDTTNANGKNTKIAKGLVIGIDCTQVYPIEGATTLCGDFTTKEAQQNIVNVLCGRKVNVVLSDMAPRATGIREMDHDNILTLAYSALRFSLLVSEIGAAFVVKLWDGQGTPQLAKDMSRFYSIVKFVKPASSRGDSAEIFLLARDFKGLKT